MAETPRSSFIPKQTTGAVPSRVKRKKHFNILSFITTVFLLGSLLFAGGTFFYRDFSQSALENEKNALADERNRFNEADMASVRELSFRIAAAEYLLDNHISPSLIFDALEFSTKERVQFTSFRFEQRPSQNISVTVQGGTEEFKTVALQALQFGDQPLLENAIFSELATAGASADAIQSGNLDLDPEGDEHDVSFSVTGEIAHERLSYTGIPGGQEEVEAPEDVLSEPEVEEGGEESFEEFLSEDVSEGTAAITEPEGGENFDIQ